MAIYLKIDGINGDVSAKGHENWIALSTIEFDVKRLLSIDPGRIADREGTRPSISEITIAKTMDKSSPLIFSEACVGKAKPKVLIDICQTSNNLIPYAQLTINNVIISGYKFHTNQINSSSQQQASSVSLYPAELVTLSFDKIELKYTPFDSQNQAQSPIPAGYDLKEATAV